LSACGDSGFDAEIWPVNDSMDATREPGKMGSDLVTTGAACTLIDIVLFKPVADRMRCRGLRNAGPPRWSDGVAVVVPSTPQAAVAIPRQCVVSGSFALAAFVAGYPSCGRHASWRAFRTDLLFWVAVRLLVPLYRRRVGARVPSPT